MKGDEKQRLQTVLLTLLWALHTDAGEMSSGLQEEQLRHGISAAEEDGVFTVTAADVKSLRKVPDEECEITRTPHHEPTTGLIQPAVEEQYSSSPFSARTIDYSSYLAEEARRSEKGIPENVQHKITEMQMGPQVADDTTPHVWLNSTFAATRGSKNGYNLASLSDQRRFTWGGFYRLHYDLGRPYEIQHTYLHWRTCDCQRRDSVKLLYSLDRKRWYQYAGISGVSLNAAAIGTLEPLYSASFTARYIRIDATRHTGKYVELYEVMFYGRPAFNPAPNIYGWYHSYQAGQSGLSGTEMLWLVPYKGHLFGGTGYWMNTGTFRPAEIVRLDCAFCDWVIESQVGTWAGRVELLKPITWTTDSSGNALAKPVEKLMASWYMNYNSRGRCYMNIRDDASKAWYLDYYWDKSPWAENYYSARAGELYHDPVTGTDLLFLSTGRDGIVAGWYDDSKNTLVSFPTTTETGVLPTRPLGITTMDGKLYLSATDHIKRRVNGLSPSWETVFSMSDVENFGSVDEAVGGIRGLTMISNSASPTGHSLLFSWNPDGNSKGCMYRLDPQSGSDALVSEKERCTSDLMVAYLGRNKNNQAASVPYVLSSYNSALEVDTGTGKIQMIGFQALLYDHSTYEFPIDPSQVSYVGGKRIGYYAGGGYLIRRSATDYEVRVPGGPRYNIYDISPKHTAVRTMSTSPWATDHTIYFGGYDANFYSATDTAWVQHGTLDAAYAADVPCQPELGCGHTPGDSFRSYGCDWCSGVTFDASAIASWDTRGRTPQTCQQVLDYLNTIGSHECEDAKQWEAVTRCCHDDCDFCEGTGLTFQPTATAGWDINGAYNCEYAKVHELYSGMHCERARLWWSGVCCA